MIGRLREKRAEGPGGFPDLPPVWMLAAALLSWILARALPLVGFPGAVLGPVIGSVGSLVILWSAWWFWRKGTPIEPGHRPRALIVEGPYRLNRNPIYSGMVAMLTGFAIWLGALSAFLPVLAFAMLIDRRFVRDEEAGLRAAFGPQAEAYFLASRRW